MPKLQITTETPTVEEMLKAWLRCEAKKETDRKYRKTPAGIACYTKSRKKYYDKNRLKEQARQKMNYKKRVEKKRLEKLLNDLGENKPEQTPEKE